MTSNKPYVPLDPALIEQARQIDLLTYLRDCEPSNLVRDEMMITKGQAFQILKSVKQREHRQSAVRIKYRLIPI